MTRRRHLLAFAFRIGQLTTRSGLGTKQALATVLVRAQRLLIAVTGLR